MRFLNKSELRARFDGRSVAIVGSGPGCLDNAQGFIDGHDVVVRVNNYRLFPATGKRTDVFYSFFGASIKKSVPELRRDGVTLCMCKCPNSAPINSPWHRQHGKMFGVDFRAIYRRRAQWWFCDTYIPEADEFMAAFTMLGKHIPTTGFSAILEILSLNPKSVYLTGFDFFTSRRHNVSEPWRLKNPGDPIGHRPEKELAWLQANRGLHPISVDKRLRQVLGTVDVAA